MAKSAFAFPVGMGRDEDYRPCADVPNLPSGSKRCKTRERAARSQSRQTAPTARQPCTKVDVRADPQLRWRMGGPPALGEERDRMESATG
jgi:hypothetical protein